MRDWKIQFSINTAYGVQGGEPQVERGRNWHKVDLWLHVDSLGFDTNRAM